VLIVVTERKEMRQLDSKRDFFKFRGIITRMDRGKIKVFTVHTMKAWRGSRHTAPLIPKPGHYMEVSG